MITFTSKSDISPVYEANYARPWRSHSGERLRGCGVEGGVTWSGAARGLKALLITIHKGRATVRAADRSAGRLVNIQGAGC